MDPEQVMMSQMTLPEALVEKIIAMMPFPLIFKARCLSKSWLARFSSISSLHVEGEKWLATSFQKEVGKWSNKWDTFCPVLCHKVETELEDFVGYNRASQDWSRIPSLSFLPRSLFYTDLLSPQIEGPLLYGFAHPETWMRDSEYCFVANVLTRCWRHLPPRPDALVTFVHGHRVVICPSSKTYKVILLCARKGEGAYHYCAQIFDSKLDAWSSSKNFEVSTDLTDGLSIVAQIHGFPDTVNFVFSTPFRNGRYTVAHLNGVVYMVATRTPQILWAFDLEEGTLEELTLSLNNDDVLRATTGNLVVCNVNWLMLVTGHEDTQRFAVQVFKIDLRERRLVPLAMSPRECPLNLGFRLLPPAADGNCILFWKVDLVALPQLHVGKRSRRRARRECFRVMAYNVDEDVWTSFPVPEETTAAGFSETPYRWFGSSFRPGLSPFVEV